MKQTNVCIWRKKLKSYHHNYIEHDKTRNKGHACTCSIYSTWTVDLKQVPDK